MEFSTSQNFPHHLLVGGVHHVGLPFGVPTFLLVFDASVYP